MRTGTKSKLSPPIVYEGNSIAEMFSAGMNHFYNTFLKKEVKPKFKGKDIFFDMDKMYHRFFSMPYPISFMHITSLDNEDKYTTFPCTNDISMENCVNECNLSSALPHYMTYQRWECLYRLARIHWIKEIIILANADDENVYIFTEVKNDGSRKFNDINIRYKCGIDDYLIVLRERKREGDLLFITAFPVISKKKKITLDKKCIK